MTTIMFSTVIGATSLIVFLLSTIYISDGVLKRKKLHKSFIDISLISVLLILILMHILFFFKFNIGEEIIDPKLVIMLLSFAVASLTIIVTVTNNKRTSENNLDVHHTNLLIKMIENNYKLINDEELKIYFKEILSLLKKEFSIEQIKYQFLVNRVIKEQPYFNARKFIHTISRNKQLSANDKKKLLGLELWKRDSVERLVLSYMQQNRVSGYKGLDMSKSFDDDVYKVIQHSSAIKIIEFLDIEKNDVLKVTSIDNMIKSVYALEEIKASINSIYNKYYPELGHFFRHTHRIVKLINKYYPDNKAKRNEFLGILRAYYSEELLLILYYNSTFTDKGLGLGLQFFAL